MPLSEHEQRLLDEMERNLYTAEADVVKTPEAGRLRPNYRGVVIGVLGVVLGLAALVGGVMMKQPVIGVVGFLLMVGGVLLAVRPSRAATDAPQERSQSRSQARPKTQSGFADRMQKRWENRRSGQ